MAGVTFYFLDQWKIGEGRHQIFFTEIRDYDEGYGEDNLFSLVLKKKYYRNFLPTSLCKKRFSRPELTVMGNLIACH